jgi:nucleoside-diphosphate-sugar epimerase
VELALERPAAKGIFNICSGRETPLVEVARRLARLARWQARLKIDLRPSEGRLRRICGDPRLARRALGFRPNISLDDGLREVLRRTERSE